MSSLVSQQIVRTFTPNGSKIISGVHKPAPDLNAWPLNMRRIAALLGEKDARFVHSLLLSIERNTGSNLAAQKAASHINSQKYPEEMLLAATSLASFSIFCRSEPPFLAALEKASAPQEWERGNWLLTLATFERKLLLPENDSRCNAMRSLHKEAFGMINALAAQWRVHTACKVPIYASLLLEATRDPAYTASALRSINAVVLEYVASEQRF